MKPIYYFLGVVCITASILCVCHAAMNKNNPEIKEAIQTQASLKEYATYTALVQEKETESTQTVLTEPEKSETSPETVSQSSSVLENEMQESETDGTETVIESETESDSVDIETDVEPETESISIDEIIVIEPEIEDVPVIVETVVESKTEPVAVETEPVIESETVLASPTDNGVQTDDKTYTEDTAEQITEEAETQTEKLESSVAEETIPEIQTPDTVQEEFLDFNKLQEVNPDIYAWIEIEGTVIDDPILQNAADDTLYLHTAYDGSESTAGAIYTESAYNSLDFNDPVTMIYGHRTIAGNMFGALRPVYSDAASFSKYDDIKIYLPGEVRHYKVFAAVPYDNLHIMYTYDFNNQYWYNNFFKNVRKIRSIEANFNDSIFPDAGDRVIILSTCIEGDQSHRYLVMAVLQDDISAAD